MSVRHPDLDHERRHRRTFARVAMWFSDWQGSPPFVAILTVGWTSELALNQVILPALGVRPFDPSTWLLNLTLSLLAAYAASLAVMGTKVVFGRLFDRLDAIEEKLDALAQPQPRARRKAS